MSPQFRRAPRRLPAPAESPRQGFSASAVEIPAQQNLADTALVSLYTFSTSRPLACSAPLRPVLAGNGTRDLRGFGA